MPPISLDEVGGISVREALPSVPLEAQALPITVDEHTTRRREFARQWIALIVVLCVAGIVIGSFICLWTTPAKTIDDVIKVIEALMSPVIGVVGAVTGFYFGESQKSAGRYELPRPGEPEGGEDRSGPAKSQSD